jgi:hypothetical protein
MLSARFIMRVKPMPNGTAHACSAGRLQLPTDTPT